MMPIRGLPRGVFFIFRVSEISSKMCHWACYFIMLNTCRTTNEISKRYCLLDIFVTKLSMIVKTTTIPKPFDVYRHYNSRKHSIVLKTCWIWRKSQLRICFVFRLWTRHNNSIIKRLRVVNWSSGTMKNVFVLPCYHCRILRYDVNNLERF